MLAPLIMLMLILAVGFAAGYGYRDYISRRRRAAYLRSRPVRYDAAP
ncbi:MAG TPA: hypothetical protein VIQ05_13470 [Tardiphaga sp.]